tara:strand:+ start:1394 stop:3124 length:1731 start_codon:yes stop_codon:yes gene_type:complete
MENLKKIWHLLPTQLKPRFIFLILLSLVGTVLEMVGISMLIPIMSSLTGQLDLIQDFSNKFNLDIDISVLTIENLLLFFFIVIFLKISILIFIIYYQNNFVFTFFTILLNKLFSNYMRRSLIFHLRNNTAEFIRNLVADTHNVTVGFMGAITSLLLEIILVIGLISIVIYLQPNVALAVIFIIALIGISLFLLIRKQISGLGKKRQLYAFLDIKYMMQGLGGIKEIKVANREKEVTDIYSTNSQNMKKVNFLISSFNQIPKLILEFLALSTLILLLITFNNLNFPFVEIISYFTIIIAAFIRLLPSANKIIISFMNITFYKPSLNILYDEIITNLDNQLKNIETKEKNNFLFKDKIEIKNIDFNYKDNERMVEVFKNASMTIDKGDMVGIVGETGSGKSTLVDLIIGLIDISKGEILVDNKNIINNKKSWNNIIGYVPQTVFLNDESFAENIYFYQELEERNKEKLLDSIKQAQLEKFVLNLPNGIDTMIGEQGQRLSGGQRQRIGIARSIYKDSEILIFDESTNSLDKETEQSFLRDIMNFKQKKTIIMISHKLSTLSNCNKIFEIKNLKINKIK